MSSPFTEDSATRKGYPVYSGFLAYFPDAIAAVAKLSKEGNDKHNAGEPLHWSREKSCDHKDCIARHLIDGDWTELAWRALANLQVEIEAGYSPFGQKDVPLPVEAYEKVTGYSVTVPLEDRTCDNCLHRDKSCAEFPCNVCNAEIDKWAPTDEETS